jgi:hypothetical protein
MREYISVLVLVPVLWITLGRPAARETHRRRYLRVGRIEVGAVQDVEELGAELPPDPSANRRLFEKIEVDVARPGPRKLSLSKLPLSALQERGRAITTLRRA